MINLLLAVLFSTGWFIIFRYFRTFKVDTFPAVVVNYWVCILTGLLTFGWENTIGRFETASAWSVYAFGLGILFISTFYLTAYSAQTIGVTLTSVSAKISLVLTVFANIFILKSASKIFDIFNYLGIFLAIVAIVLSSIQPKTNENQEQKAVWWLPLLIFLLTATVDITVNSINAIFVKPEQSALFSILTFGSAAVVGFVILSVQLILKQRKIGMKEFLGGVALGIPNFFSLFYLLKALENFKNDGAFLFPIFNIAIILASSTCAVILFKEKLSKLNLLGLAIAILSIFLIAYQEIIKL
ncbi:MAG: hypothetical protein EAZ85_11510 [Bacteroidetes bacterium]|nr:MAG: hypothetical protein EAZ85_11510 [Bacteroidota bacterium]TAG87991.1 MAG: hypothetical protein EAZ20_09510 [Bacteroidota bacterium]